MFTKEQKLKATEHFLNIRLDGEGEVIRLKDKMTYADFLVIDEDGFGLVYISPDGDTEFRIKRDDFERDAIKVLSEYGGEVRGDVYPSIITFLFIDDDETKALIRCHHRPPFKEDE